MTGVALPAAIATPDWPAIARRSRRERLWKSALLHGFLFVCSLPVLVPYLWLLTLAWTPSNGSNGVPVLWRVVSIVLPALFGWLMIGATVGNPRRRLQGYAILLIVAVVALAVLVGPALSPVNWRFLWTTKLVTDGQRGVADYTSVWVAVGNSLALAVAEMILVTVVATLAAYYLSRFEFRGRTKFLSSLLILQAFPVYTLVIPIFLLLHWVHLLDTLPGVVLVISTLELPLAIFIMKGFFDAVPWDIEMSAMTDGASRRQAFLLVVLPQVKVGMIVVGIFSFLRGWEEFVFVATLLISKGHWVMSLYLYGLQSENMSIDHGLFAAIALFYILPSLGLYACTQRYLTQVSFGGIKG